MNLKGRIKKLEKTTNIDGFCACRKIWTETFWQDLTEDSKNTEPVLNGKSVPDICERCNSLTRKEQMVIQLVDSTTKEGFPEEWSK